MTALAFVVVALVAFVSGVFYSLHLDTRRMAALLRDECPACKVRLPHVPGCVIAPPPGNAT